MADGGFDPCECIWNHENAMQRLMNLVSPHRPVVMLCSDVLQKKSLMYVSEYLL